MTFDLCSDPLNPTWIKDKCLVNRDVDYIDEDESQFWKELIAKYLYPIDANPEKEKHLAQQLMELRNKCVFYFFLLNAIFVLLIFLLELEKDTISVDWPLDTSLQLEPIATVFLIFFATILLIQFVAMLFHRWGTLSHILASLELFFMTLWKKRRAGKDAGEGITDIGVIKKIQKISLAEAGKIF